MYFFIKILDKWIFMFIFDRPFSHNKMPRTEQQLKEIRKERKQAIMETAMSEFAEHGYRQRAGSYRQIFSYGQRLCP